LEPFWGKRESERGIERASFVGRTPWSARDAPVPLFSRKIPAAYPAQPTRGSAADLGVRPTIRQPLPSCSLAVGRAAQRRLGRYIVSRGNIGDPRKSRKQAFRELAQVVDELRREAKENSIDQMTKRQIEAAVAAARRDPKRER